MRKSWCGVRERDEEIARFPDGVALFFVIYLQSAMCGCCNNDTEVLGLGRGGGVGLQFWGVLRFRVWGLEVVHRVSNKGTSLIRNSPPLECAAAATTTPRFSSALEATQGAMDGFFSQTPYEYHLEEVASL